MLTGANAEHLAGRRLNPPGSEGEVSRCLICDSKYHWARQCPHSYENRGKSSKEEETDCVQLALFIGYTGEMESFKLNSLVNESKVSAVLDTGCSTTVCGGQWLSEYLKTLSDYESSKIVEEDSTRTFTFGDGKKFKSLKRVTLPCVIGGARATVTTEVVECNVPLLLSCKSMKTANMVLNFNDDSIVIGQTKIKLGLTSSGHFTFPLSM